jgi:uncharacterized repeat protein (TIGR03943 family)
VNVAGGTISVLVGAVLLRLTLTDTYLRYVRIGLGPWLALAGVAVIALGVLTIWNALRGTDAEDAHGHPHDHGDGIGVGWLLLAPIAALLLVAPPTLGSYGIERGATIKVRTGKSVFQPLPRDAPPRPMSLLEFGERAFDHSGKSFNGATVQLTGFSAGSDAGGFRLARYQIACCAADATPMVVRVVGTSGDSVARDQWVTVTGRFRSGGDELPVITATSVAAIPPPRDPYE